MESNQRKDKDMGEAWECLNTEMIHQNPWYGIRLDQVRRPDGSLGKYYVVDKPLGSVYIVALKGETLLMVEQFRYTLGRDSLEVPAGGNEEGLTPLQNAQKELAEETGYHAETWAHVGRFAHLNGYGNEEDDVYLATDLRRADTVQHQDESEFLHLQELLWDEVWTKIHNGEIDCAGTITSLTLARPYVEKLLSNA